MSSVDRAMSRSQAPVEFTGYTLSGDELVEWHDAETGQHAVDLNRAWQGGSDVTFYFDMRDEAHALFLALCQVKCIVMEGDAS